MSEDLKQLSDHVWYFPSSSIPETIQPNVGVILGTHETILIDAVNTPTIAQQLVNELKRVDAPPISKVIYTHHHWEHVFGAYIYGVEAVPRSLCQQLLKEEASKPWSLSFLESEVKRSSNFRE